MLVIDYVKKHHGSSLFFFEKKINIASYFNK